MIDNLDLEAQKLFNKIELLLSKDESIKAKKLSMMLSLPYPLLVISLLYT